MPTPQPIIGIATVGETQNLEIPPDIKATLKPGEKYLIWQSQETIFLKKVQKPKGFADLWQRMDEIGDDPNPLSTEDICQLVKEVRQEQTQQNHETPS